MARGRVHHAIELVAEVWFVRIQWLGDSNQRSKAILIEPVIISKRVLWNAGGLLMQSSIPLPCSTYAVYKKVHYLRLLPFLFLEYVSKVNLIAR